MIDPRVIGVYGDIFPDYEYPRTCPSECMVPGPPIRYGDITKTSVFPMMRSTIVDEKDHKVGSPMGRRCDLRDAHHGVCYFPHQRLPLPSGLNLYGGYR